MHCGVHRRTLPSNDQNHYQQRHNTESTKPSSAARGLTQGCMRVTLCAQNAQLARATGQQARASGVEA